MWDGAKAMRCRKPISALPMCRQPRSGGCAALHESISGRAKAAVHFDLGPRDLSSVTEAGDHIVAAGAYRISIGDGQPGTGAPAARCRFTVEGNTSLPE